MVRSNKAQEKIAAASQQYGSYSGHHKCDNGISLAILLTTLAGIASLFFILFTRITMFTGRRRRKRSSSEDSDPDAWDKVDEGLGYFDSDRISEIIFSGTSCAHRLHCLSFCLTPWVFLFLSLACSFHLTAPQLTLWLIEQICHSERSCSTYSVEDV